MAPRNRSAKSLPLTTLQYTSLRSVTSPEDQDADRKRYCGIVRADELFQLNWDENVRSYLGADDEGKKRKPTLVNLAIRNTVSQNRDYFPILNTGVVIVARNVDVDDKKKIARLSGASVINGAQTCGELKAFFQEHPNDDGFPSVSFELLVTDDEDLIAEISIARNFQNRVADLSIYGRQGLLNDLQAELQKDDPTIKLRTRETDFGDEYLDTEKLIQVITALSPSDVRLPSAEKRTTKTPETQYRVYAYRHRARCLKDFATVMGEPNEWSSTRQFFLEMAWQAWALYGQLKGEQAFSSLKKVSGDYIGGRKIVTSDGVPDGIVFPMLSALSRFVSIANGRWKINIPKSFPWQTLFNQAAAQWKNVAAHNPNTMGKSADCYIALHGVLEMYFAATSHK